MTPSPCEDLKAHERALAQALATIIAAEADIREVDGRFKSVHAEQVLTTSQAKKRIAEAWEAIRALMAETGEVEVVLRDQATDFKIAWSAGRESVKVADPDAVPEEFCKVERKPKLKEIGEHLRLLRDGGQALPNWASLERGEPTLGYKPVKKGAA